MNICSGLLWPFYDYWFIVCFLQKVEYESEQVCSKIWSVSTHFLMSKLGLCGVGKSLSLQTANLSIQYQHWLVWSVIHVYLTPTSAAMCINNICIYWSHSHNCKIAWINKYKKYILDVLSLTKTQPAATIALK